MLGASDEDASRKRLGVVHQMSAKLSASWRVRTDSCCFRLRAWLGVNSSAPAYTVVHCTSGSVSSGTATTICHKESILVAP